MGDDLLYWKWLYRVDLYSRDSHQAQYTDQVQSHYTLSAHDSLLALKSTQTKTITKGMMRIFEKPSKLRLSVIIYNKRKVLMMRKMMMSKGVI